MIIFVGVDPGQTGAIACLELHGGILNNPLPIELLCRVWDIPQKRDGGIGFAQLANIILNDLPSEVAAIAIEKVGVRPGQGVSSSGKFMYGAGFLHGILMPVANSLHFVTPQEWKKSLKLIGKDKQASLALARRLFPSLRSGLTRLKDHGRAEALLICWWLVTQQQPRYAKAYLQTLETVQQ